MNQSNEIVQQPKETLLNQWVTNKREHTWTRTGQRTHARPRGSETRKSSRQEKQPMPISRGWLSTPLLLVAHPLSSSPLRSAPLLSMDSERRLPPLVFPFLFFSVVEPLSSIGWLGFFVGLGRPTFNRRERSLAALLVQCVKFDQSALPWVRKLLFILGSRVQSQPNHVFG
jgi:hypothetical protein